MKEVSFGMTTAVFCHGTGIFPLALIGLTRTHESNLHPGQVL